MIRLGLCCVFKNQKISFRRTTAAYLKTLKPAERKTHLSAICLHNARALFEALQYCNRNGIGAFRVNSQILPVKTHPEVGYRADDLPGHGEIVETFLKCGRYSRRNNIRTTFHPDQFIVLSSPDRDVVKRAVEDLRYHAEVAGWINADVINIHAGGAYGDKPRTLKRLVRQIQKLPEDIFSRLTLENDDRTYMPRDLIGVCKEAGVPLVYDVHHHRCLPDGTSIEETTAEALLTWGREPLFHISSPFAGWHRPDSYKHHDYINVKDFPRCWCGLDITVEVEAKAKELAVLKMKKQLAARCRCEEKDN